MARRDPAGQLRRPGRLQMEHGLDERLLGISAGADLPAVPPPRDDLRHGVRLFGKLHSADQPRRGRAARVRCSSACRRTSGASSAPASVLRLHVGPSARNSSSWAPSSASAVSSRRPAASTGVERGLGHRGVQRLIKDMNGIYREHPAFWKLDTDASGFSWINADDRGGNVFSWLRFDGDGQMIACVTNFSTEPRPDYRIGFLDRCLEGDFEHRRRCLRRHWADRQSRPGRRHRSPRPRISGVGGRDCATARRGLAAVRAGAGRRTRRAGEGGGRRTCQGTEAIAGAFAVGVGVGVPPGATPAPDSTEAGGEKAKPRRPREPAARTSTRSRRPLFSRRPAPPPLNRPGRSPAGLPIRLER